MKEFRTFALHTKTTVSTVSIADPGAHDEMNKNNIPGEISPESVSSSPLLRNEVITNVVVRHPEDPGEGLLGNIRPNITCDPNSVVSMIHGNRPLTGGPGPQKGFKNINLI